MSTTPLAKILVLDDDPLMLAWTSTVLRASGFETRPTSSQHEALEAAVRGEIDVLVTDLHMPPHLPGTVILSMVARSNPNVGRVLLTAEENFARVAEMLAPGTAHAFVAKSDAAKHLPAVLHQIVAQRANGLHVGTDDGRGLARGIVRALALRDYETEAHCHRVAALTKLLAQQLGLRGRALIDAELGALLHDMGKIGVRDAVLFKPGPLTDTEWAEMRKHPELGSRLLEDTPPLRGAIDVVLNHHERWLGGGYPRNLSGEQIPVAARVFQIADTFDAIVSDRPYRKGQSSAAARAEIARGAGTQFDPRIVEAFVSIDVGTWDHVARTCEVPDTLGR